MELNEAIRIIIRNFGEEILSDQKFFNVLLDYYHFDMPAKKRIVQSLIVDKQLEELLFKKDYISAINKLNDIKPYLDNFFENVMVMCEDENIKLNRISLINYITTRFNSFINLSSLQ